MTQKTSRKIIAVVLVILAAAAIMLGAMNLPQRTGEKGSTIIDALRIRTLLNATGDGVVESYVAIAKKEATAKVKAEGGGMSAIREAVAKAEEETRAKYSNTTPDYSTLDTTALEAAVSEYAALLEAYDAVALKAENAYIEENMAAAQAEAQAKREAKIAAGEEVGEETEVTVDMSGFVATEEMNAAKAKADEQYAVVGEALKGIYPVLDDSALATLKATIEGVVYTRGDDYTVRYDRYMAAGSGAALDSKVSGFMIRYADDLIYVGVGLIIAALVRRNRIDRKDWLRIVLFVLGICVVIGMEFAKDKLPVLPIWSCYAIMAAASAVMGYSAWYLVLKHRRG